MASHKKKDYYQFCYDENEIVSSNDSSYDDEDLNSINADENSDDEEENESVCSGDDDDDDNDDGDDDEKSSCENIDQTITVVAHSSPRQERQNNDAQYVRSQSYSDYLDDIVLESSEKDYLPERRSKSCCFDTDPFDGMDPMIGDTVACSTDSVLSSPTSESIELDGYVIEIDEATNTINISSSPPPNIFLPMSTSTEYLTVPELTDDYSPEDDLSSSGVSLDSRLSSANSLTTEINRLRNINSPIYIKDTPYHQRYRVSNAAFGGSEDRLSRKSAAKSLNSLLSRSSTPERKSPLLDFLKGKGKISEAKSDFDLIKKKKDKTAKLKSGKESLTTSMFRLKRSSSPFKRRTSKQRNSVVDKTPSKGIEHTSDPELTLQQPSPFVRTIFQFIETDNDEIFPFGSLNTNYENYKVPVFSCNHGKLFQDVGKTNSLSRRASKNKHNLSTIKRTVYQDGHDPIFLSSCRRVCENSDFLISTIAFLDRVRKVQETPPKTIRDKRHNAECSNNVQAEFELQQQQQQQDDISNRLGSYNTIRRRFNLPLTIHERFSTFFDSGVFDEDLILSSSDCLFKSGLPQSRSRSFSNLSSSNEKDKTKGLSLAQRSKSLKNLAYGSFRRKDKKKQKSREKLRRSSDVNTPNKKESVVRDGCEKVKTDDGDENMSCIHHSSMHSENQNCLDGCSNSHDVDNATQQKTHQVSCSSISSGCNCGESSLKPIKIPAIVCEGQEKLFKQERPNSSMGYNNEQWKRENTPHNSRDIFLTQNVNNSDQVVAVNKDSSSTRHSSPVNSDYVEKQYKPIRFLTDKLRNKNKKSKIAEVEHWTENMSTSNSMDTTKASHLELVDSSAKGVTNLRKQFEDVVTTTTIRNDNDGDSSNKMADTGKEQKDGRRKSGIRRSLSWRVKKDKPMTKGDGSSGMASPSPSSPASPTSPSSPVSPMEKGGNRLLSICSKFEVVSPTEKKKWNLLPLSPSVKRSHKNSSKEFKFHKHSSNNDDTDGSTFSSATSTQTDSAADEEWSDQSKSPISPKSVKSPTTTTDKFTFSSNTIMNKNSSASKVRRNRNKSNSSSASERKISNEMLKEIISGSTVISPSPSPPTKSIDDGAILSSSDLYSSDSSFLEGNRSRSKTTPDTTSRKMNRKSSNDSSGDTAAALQKKTPKQNVASNDEGRIVVDVPLHLLPPDLSGHPRSSPKSSPKNGLRHSFSMKSPRTLSSSPPITSPVVKQKKRSSFERINFNSGSKEAGVVGGRPGSSIEEISKSQNEINNNNFIRYKQTMNSSHNEQTEDQNSEDVAEITTSTSSPPAVKPKPKLRSVAVVKPKTLPSNIAMVSPIMKSEMMTSQPVQSSPAITTTTAATATNDARLMMAELAISPFKTVRRRPATNSPIESTKNCHSEAWDVVKRLELSLLLDQDAERKSAVKIESLEVQNANSYRDIEELAIQSFIDHLRLLDKQMLDIGKDDVMCLQLGKKKVSIGSSLDLSSSNVEDGCLPCQLCLKGKKDWSLAAMAYDTLIPKSFLEKYVSLILTHRQVIFYGPSGTGKSYVSRRVASIITQRMNENRIPTIIFKNITESQWKTLLRSISDDKKSEPYVVLLDGFAPSFIKSEKDLTEIINACETVHPQPYVICTVTQSPNYEIPTPWQNSFKWIWLPNHEEPVDGLLQRYLRRRYIQTGDKDKDRTEEAFRIADWLASTWRHINDILEKYHSTECTIGPTMFYTCPTDVLCVEEWFVDLWNYSITPYFIQTVKSGLKLFGQRYDWVDPLERILKTYPWMSAKNQRITKLRRIRPEDVGYQPNNPPSCPSSPTQYSEIEKERLLDFLRQLELLMHDGGLGELPSFDEASRDPVESSI